MPVQSAGRAGQNRQPPAYSAAEAAAIMGGRVVWGNPLAQFHGAAFDSRHVERGELFFAIKGEHTDGHLYLLNAVERGATCLLVSTWNESVSGPVLRAAAGEAPSGHPLAERVAVLAVEDTVAAVGRLARWHRNRFKLPVIGITGSVGKTTAKDMAAHILERRFDLLASEGNLNSDVSLPVVLLRLDGRHEAAVLEMATRGQGQLEYLASLALPSIGAVTTVAPVHIETLGSLAGVAKAKAELLRCLSAGGVAVYNADSIELRSELAKGGVEALLVGFGFGLGSDVRAEAATTVFARSGSRVEASLTFSVVCRPGAPAERLGLPTVGSLQATIPYPGRHNVTNVLAAALVAAGAGVPFAEGLDSLSRFRPKSAMRLDIATVGERVLIDDAYNANLLSMTAALEVLAGVAASGRRIAVLADMLELGPIEAETHRELGRQVPKWGVDLLVCVGPASRATAQVAIGEGMDAAAVFWTDDRQVAADFVLRNAQPGDAVLVKGSRGMAMEHVVRALRQGWQA